jgi:hypothetical protein
MLHAGRYPKMEPADAVKFAYQSVFGGGHLIASEANSLAFLTEERKKTCSNKRRNAPQEAFLPIGLGYARMNLGSPSLLPLPDALLNRMFVRSAQEPGGDMKTFQRALEEVVRAAADGAFAFSMEALDSYLDKYRAAGSPMVRHSETYRRAYLPAYRVVDGAYAALLPLIRQIQGALDRGSLPATFAIEKAHAPSAAAIALLSGLFNPVSLSFDAAACTLSVRRL